ncbi:HIT family protein [Brachybacterium sp. FME24]|uniref:HIT family protein n=1 Tax=Brachybacterium sp. FME24 TaxID=2742605 RepID=UPI0018682ABF|nr:HIT family protein [Brachybacterium sp. FME24]
MTIDVCVFCRISTRELDASVVFESASVLAFMDVDPVTAGHVLVIPKAHLPELSDLGDAIATEMFAVARAVAAALRRSSLPCEGINLFYADGEAASQEVFHSHMHVFPRCAGDGFTIDARWGSNPQRSDLDDHAERIRSALEPTPPGRERDERPVWAPARR